MAKELPYFKFEPGAWDNGNIQMCSREAKGLFIDLCSIYWSRLGELPEKLATRKVCAGAEEALNELIEEGIVEITDGFVSIFFLDKQLSEFKKKSELASESAKSRWSPIPERTQGQQVYVIRCWNEREEFLKIGETSTSINRRFSGKIPYNFEALIIDLGGKIDTENRYQDIAKSFIYEPKKKFPGSLECYKTECFGELKAFATVRNAKFIREYVVRNAIREEKKREEEKKIEIIYPFDSDDFKNAWKTWIKYKKDQHSFTYKSGNSEQIALNQLLKLSGGIEKNAIDIIEQSIASGYKGLFALKNQQPAKPKSKNTSSGLWQ